MSRDEMRAPGTGPYAPLDRLRRDALDQRRREAPSRSRLLLDQLALHGPTPVRVLADVSGLSVGEARAALHALTDAGLVSLIGPGASRDWRIASLTSSGEARLRTLRN